MFQAGVGSSQATDSIQAATEAARAAVDAAGGGSVRVAFLLMRMLAVFR